MILADKIIINRKKLNLTQEGLAAEINVSRQAVSKWESAQSIPEMEKIILLSNLFGVSVDYLIRDEIDDVEYLDSDQLLKTKQLSLNDVNSFLEKSYRSSKYVSFAVMLCIISPIALITLTSLVDLNLINISNNIASSIGIVVMLILVSIAVGIFITNSSYMSEFDYLEKENFDLDYGVEGIVKQKQASRRNNNTMSIVIGVILLILSILPIIIIDGFAAKGTVEVYAVPTFLFIVSIAVFTLVNNGIKQGAYSKVLQEKDYAVEKKASSKIYGKISGIYWLSATTLYLAYSFIYNAWGNSWIIWPIAGVLFPIVIIITSLIIKED